MGLAKGAQFSSGALTPSRSINFFDLASCFAVLFALWFAILRGLL